MANPNQLMTELLGVVGVIDPDAYVAGAQSTGWISAASAHQFMALLLVGTITATGTLIMKLEQATDVGGTGAKDIAGKVITILTAAGTDSDKQAAINLKPAELDVQGGFTHFRATTTGVTAAADHGVAVLGMNFREGRGDENNLTSVDEIIE